MQQSLKNIFSESRSTAPVHIGRKKAAIISGSNLWIKIFG